MVAISKTMTSTRRQPKAPLRGKISEQVYGSRAPAFARTCCDLRSLRRHPRAPKETLPARDRLRSCPRQPRPHRSNSCIARRFKRGDQSLCNAGRLTASEPPLRKTRLAGTDSSAPTSSSFSNKKSRSPPGTVGTPRTYTSRRTTSTA